MVGQLCTEVSFEDLERVIHLDVSNIQTCYHTHTHTWQQGLSRLGVTKQEL